MHVVHKMKASKKVENLNTTHPKFSILRSSKHRSRGFFPARQKMVVEKKKGAPMLRRPLIPPEKEGVLSRN